MSDVPIQPRSIRERVEEVYRRLRLLPRASSAEDALLQLCQTLEQVEDEWSGVPKQESPPPPSSFDGRMYCPLSDFIWRMEDGTILALTRGHRIEIGSDGLLRITNKLTGLVEFEK